MKAHILLQSRDFLLRFHQLELEFTDLPVGVSWWKPSRGIRMDPAADQHHTWPGTHSAGPADEGLCRSPGASALGSGLHPPRSSDPAETGEV